MWSGKGKAHMSSSKKREWKPFGIGVIDRTCDDQNVFFPSDPFEQDGHILGYAGQSINQYILSINQY